MDNSNVEQNTMQSVSGNKERGKISWVSNIILLIVGFGLGALTMWGVSQYSANDSNENQQEREVSVTEISEEYSDDEPNEESETVSSPVASPEITVVATTPARMNKHEFEYEYDKRNYLMTFDKIGNSSSKAVSKERFEILLDEVEKLYLVITINPKIEPLGAGIYGEFVGDFSNDIVKTELFGINYVKRAETSTSPECEYSGQSNPCVYIYYSMDKTGYIRVTSLLKGDKGFQDGDIPTSKQIEKVDTLLRSMEIAEVRN